ncbi:MAG: type II toxin-antitoxin system HicB family antitoxin [Betaproteobacteria bacterium]|nr:type II toxin-antitoxin system HicB family antitoxin [Betaproteobacteria bacterium]
MMNAMTHKGYMDRVEFDPRDEIFVGRVLGIADSITFHGTTVAELTRDFRCSITHYLADCVATGRTPQKPASGKLMLRIPPEVHTAVSIAAQAAGKSLNQWATETLKAAAMA